MLLCYVLARVHVRVCNLHTRKTLIVPENTCICVAKSRIVAGFLGHSFAQWLYPHHPVIIAKVDKSLWSLYLHLIALFDSCTLKLPVTNVLWI